MDFSFTDEQSMLRDTLASWLRTRTGLEAAHAGYGALRSPYLGRKIGEGRKVGAQQSRILRKLGTGELHAIAAIAGKFDHHVLNYFLCACHKEI